MYRKVQKWFWISVLHDNKRDILLNGIILSGTHCTYTKYVKGISNESISTVEESMHHARE